MRVTPTAYNSGTYSATPPSGNTFNMYPTSAPWLLNLFSDRLTSLGSSRFHREFYCFAPDTGFLNAKRTIKNPVPNSPNLAPNDVYVTYDVYKPDGSNPDGNVASEQYFGADDGGASTASACAQPTGPPAYRIDHTYQAGTLASTQYYSGSSPMAFKSLDLDIDQSTGLPARSRDTAGVCTSFAYDTMNRLTWVKPGDASGASGCTVPTPPNTPGAPYGAWVQRSYGAGTPSCDPASNPLACAFARATAYASGTTSGSPLADSQIIFDRLGRVASERQKLPDTTLNERITNYNPDGSKAFVSELAQQGQATFGTTFLDYDAFGRPGTVKGADGKRVDFTYQGVRATNRFVDIATGANGTTTTSRVTEFNNHLGRLHRVSEPPLDSNLLPTANTNYDYDAMGNLVAVDQRDGLTPVHIQTRTFNYDGRGFLTSEIHPEKTGAVSYSSYDARGHFRQKTDGGVVTQWAYDAAERLLSVASAGQPVKEFRYDEQTFGRCC